MPLQRFRGNSLGARVLRGSAFNLLTFGGERGLRFVSNIILTRILFPEAFGMMVLVQTVIYGLEMFSDTGLNASIIQSKRGEEPAFLATAWSAQIIRGVLLWLLACLLAGPAARFYGEPMLAQLLPVAAFTTVIMGFVSTRLATANKKILMGRITVLQLGTQCLGVVVTILLALWLQSVWALVFGGLLGRLANSALSHVILPGAKDRIGWDWGAFREIFDFGKFILIGSVASFFLTVGDRAILGQFVSLTELAVYNIGWLLAALPMALSRSFARKILFPLYASNPPAESHANRRKVAKARYTLTGTMLAACLVLGLVGDALVRLLYLPDYHLAGPILVLVTLATMPTIILAAYQGQLLGAGNSRDATIMTVVTALVQTSLLYLGISRFGIPGVMIAISLSPILVYPLTLYLLRRKKAWDALHDGVYFGLAVLIALLVLSVHSGAIDQVMAGAG